MVTSMSSRPLASPTPADTAQWSVWRAAAAGSPWSILQLPVAVSKEGTPA